MKYIFKLLLVGGILIFILSFIPYQNTNYSYKEVIQLKSLQLYKAIFLNGKDILDKYDDEKIKSLDVKVYHLLIDEKRMNYFDDLWSKYESDAPANGSKEYSKKGFEYYKENRKWVKVKAIENLDTFKVKMRTHGIQPDGHHLGNYFLFHLKKTKKVFSKKKMKFIIGERVNYTANINEFYSNKMNLIWAKPNEAVKVKINNYPEKLFYLEDKFFDPLSRPLISTSYKSYKSGIQAL